MFMPFSAICGRDKSLLVERDKPKVTFGQN